MAFQLETIIIKFSKYFIGFFLSFCCSYTTNEPNCLGDLHGADYRGVQGCGDAQLAATDELLGIYR